MISETVESGIKSKPDSTPDRIELLNKIWTWQLQSEAAISEVNFRVESKEDYAFFAGNQDTADVRSELIEQKRPATTFNTILPKVNMLIGLAGQSNRVPYLFPVSSEDEALTELMNGAFKHFRRKTKATRKENECFEHAVKGGRSLLHFYVGGDNPFEPELKTVRISGRDFMLDPTGIEYDLSDSRYIIVDKWLSKEDISAVIPDFNDSDITLLTTGGRSDVPSFYNSVTDKYRITECWYRKYEFVIWFENPMTGKTEQTTEINFKRFKEALKNGIDLGEGKIAKFDKEIKSYKRMTKKVYYIIFSGTKVLEEGPSPYTHSHFPYVLFGAYKNEDENRWFSVITMMKDPQRGRNTMRRQLQHLLQTAPKGLLAHEIGALADPEDYDKNSSQPNYRLTINQGKFDKWRFSEQPEISPIYASLDQTYEQDMKDSSGIQNDLMGIETSSRQPGVTLRLRQQTGMAVLYVLFDNFRESRLQAAEIMVSMIQQYIKAPQLIRIEGQEGQQLLEINSQTNPQLAGYNDITAMKYDFAIDEAVENTTMRMAIAQMLTEFAQNNPGSVPPDMILEYSDMPLTARIKVRQFFEQQQQREERMMQMKVEADREKGIIRGQTEVYKANKIASSRKEVKTKK